MYVALEGQKLLILGAYSTEIEIINAAKELGVYTIVTDNHDNWDDAPAKKEADEAWNISWSDIDFLAKKCKEENVNGILAGFSERRISYAKQLCEVLHKPFYADGSKLDVIIRKEKFKKACVESGITVPKCYDLAEKIEFPVIVKPSDNAGSRGISVCSNKEELQVAYERALLVSDKKNVLIEEYLDADEIVIYFDVYDGDIKLSALCDRCMKKFVHGKVQLPVLYYYKSKHYELFVENFYNKFKLLITSLGIRNGLIGIQCLVKDNDIIPYDPTYRLDGSVSFHLTDKINNINALKMLIHYSLTGQMEIQKGDKDKENSVFDEYAATVIILLGKGVISDIRGLDKIKKCHEVVHISQKKDKGDKLLEAADFSQIFCRILICAKEFKDLKETVQFIDSELCVYDENGNDMIINHGSFMSYLWY